MEERTGNVEHSLVLCHFAVTEQGILALAPLLETLSLLHHVLYEYGYGLCADSECAKVDGPGTLSLAQFEAMDAAQRMLAVLSRSTAEKVVEHIGARSPYFVSERDLPSLLLAVCPELAGMGRIDLVAATLEVHEQFDLCSAMRPYLDSPDNVFLRNRQSPKSLNSPDSKTSVSGDGGWDDFDDHFDDELSADDDSGGGDGADKVDGAGAAEDGLSGFEGMDDVDLLMEFGFLCALRCGAGTPWRGLNALMATLRAIDRERGDKAGGDLMALMASKRDGMSPKLALFTALIGGGEQLAASYGVERSLLFYHTLYHLGHITSDDDGSERTQFRRDIMAQHEVGGVREAVRRWKDTLTVSDHELLHYQPVHDLLQSSLVDTILNVHF